MSGFLIGTVPDRRHSSLTLESSSDPVVDTLGFPPICVDTFVGVALVTIEALRAYKTRCQQKFLIVPAESSENGGGPERGCLM